MDLAARHNQLILVHTPHLEDKHKGTRLILDVLRNDHRIRPERALSTTSRNTPSQMVLDAGFWAGMTLYPETKCTAARAVDMIERYGRRTVVDEQRLRLGRQRAFGRPVRRLGNAPPGPQPRRHRQNDLPESTALFEPVPEFQAGHWVVVLLMSGGPKAEVRIRIKSHESPSNSGVRGMHYSAACRCFSLSPSAGAPRGVLLCSLSHGLLSNRQAISAR